MSWLLRDDHVLAAIEEAGRRCPATLQGAVVLRGPRMIHTLSRPVGLDVAWCVQVPDADKEWLEVRRLSCLGPRRVARPRLSGDPVVVATQGAFERWRLTVGDRLEIRKV